jgi:predicted branched-subunit amino acid permease
MAARPHPTILCLSEPPEAPTMTELTNAPSPLLGLWHSIEAQAARDIAPIALSTAPFGVLVGVSVGGLGMHPMAALTGTLLVYGGSAQLTATTLLHSGTGILVVLATVAAIQSRLLLYGAGLEPLFRHQPAAFRWLAPITIVDQTFALAASKATALEEPARFRRYWLSTGAVLGASWLAAVGTGIALGPILPASSPLTIAVPAVFVGLIIPHLQGRPAVVAAAVAYVVAGVAVGLPHGAGLVVAIAAGIAAGRLTAFPDRSRTRRG